MLAQIPEATVERVAQQQHKHEVKRHVHVYNLRDRSEGGPVSVARIMWTLNVLEALGLLTVILRVDAVDVGLVETHGDKYAIKDVFAEQSVNELKAIQENVKGTVDVVQPNHEE